MANAVVLSGITCLDLVNLSRIIGLLRVFPVLRPESAIILLADHLCQSVRMRTFETRGLIRRMPDQNDTLSALLARLDSLSSSLEAIFGPAPPVSMEPDVLAWRWRSINGRNSLQPVRDIHRITTAELVGLDRQIGVLDANTRQFVQGLPCNNALLWGARGTGKSSLVKAMLNRYAPDGMRVIEIDAHDLIDLPQVVEPLTGRPERFVLFVDDLSFDADDASYRTLKAALDGSVAIAPENVIIYATSNRRHLVPELKKDNEDSHLSSDGEIHHGEAVEEKISLSERFGIWLSFHPFSQQLYLEAVSLWLRQTGGGELTDEAREEALRWALLRGNRSGRIAAQFARDWTGRQQLRD